MKKIFFKLLKSSKEKIGVKVGIIVTLIMSLTIISMGTFFIQCYKRDMTNSIENNLLEKVQKISDQMSIKLEEKTLQLENFTKDEDIKSMDWEKQKEILGDAIDSWKFLDLYVVKANGLCKSPLDEEEINYTGKDFFEEIKSNGDTVTILDPETNDYGSFITISVPIKQGNAIVGYLLGDIDISDIDFLMNNVDLGVSGYSSIINNEGLFIYHNDQTYVSSQKNINDEISNKDIISELINSDTKITTAKDIFNSNNFYASSCINFNKNWHVIITTNRSEALSTVKDMVYILIGTILLCIIISVTLALLLNKEISKDVEKIKLYSKEIGNNNLSIDLQGKPSNEIGYAIQDLNEGINKVCTAIDKVKNSSNEICEGSNNINNSIQISATQVQTVASTIEEISANLEECDNSMQDIKQLIYIVNEKTNESVLKCKKELVHTEKIREKATILYKDSVKAKEVIEQIYENCSHELKESLENIIVVQEVSKIISNIADISDQINLLALNASIESAKAGEKGLGFSVIASEIRNLSEQTKDSVSKISQTITSAIKEVDKLSLSSNKLLTVVENDILTDYNKLIDVSKSYKETGEDFEKMLLTMNNITENISSTTDDVSNNIKNVSTALSAVSKATITITNNIVNINCNNEKIVDKSNSTMQKAEELRDDIKIFKTNK